MLCTGNNGDNIPVMRDNISNGYGYAWVIASWFSTDLAVSKSSGSTCLGLDQQRYPYLDPYHLTWHWYNNIVPSKCVRKWEVTFTVLEPVTPDMHAVLLYFDNRHCYFCFYNDLVKMWRTHVYLSAVKNKIVVSICYSTIFITLYRALIGLYLCLNVPVGFIGPYNGQYIW